MSESKVPVGDTGLDLRTVEQVTDAGIVHTEAVFITDPVDVDERMRVESGRALVNTGLTQPTTPTDTQPVSGTVTANQGAAGEASWPVHDDFATGQILDDQTSVGSLLTFNFSPAADSIWVYAVNPSDLTEVGEIRVQPFEGASDPSSTHGLPIQYGTPFPLTIRATAVRVFAASGIRVTVIGYSR